MRTLTRRSALLATILRSRTGCIGHPVRRDADGTPRAQARLR
jgi:hypothetical protein